MAKTALECSPRWGTPRRADRKTYGPLATQVAGYLGLELMPWQQHVLDVALEVDDETERLAYRQVFLSVPRQSGKTALLLVLWVLRCMAMGPRQQVIYTAQDRNSAREKWERDFLDALEASQLEAGRDFRVRKSNGSEATQWTNGSLQTISATLASSAHGRSLDLVMIDEAFEHRDAAAIDGSFGPPMLTRPEPQMWVVSTAGTHRSTFLNDRRESARAAAVRDEGRGLACFEWSADPEWDLWDRERWPEYMPALGHSQTEEAVAGLIGVMSEQAARRAFMNLTTEADEDDSSGMDLEAWSRQVDGGSAIDSNLVLAVDGSPDRRWGTLAAAGLRADGQLHVELIETRAGLGWLGGRAIEVARQQGAKAVAVDPSSSAGSIMDELEAAGVEVHKMPARAHAHAAGTLYDRTVDGVLWHRGQAELQAAVVAARKRPLGDAWAWDRRNEDDNLTPLVAVTLAAGAVLALAEAPEEPSVYDEREGFVEW